MVRDGHGGRQWQGEQGVVMGYLSALGMIGQTDLTTLHAFYTQQATQRHFYRCRVCLSIVAVDGAPWGHQDVGCGVCGRSQWHYMGRVAPSGRLMVDHVASVCDERCTCARGPLCDCRCGGKNHGAGMLVVVNVADVGAIPTVTPPRDRGAAKTIADEWSTTETQALAAIERRYGATLRAKNSGQWVADFGAYLAGKRLVRALNEARACQVHKKRMAQLATIIAQTDANEVRS